MHDVDVPPQASAAQLRFSSCRWARTAADELPAHCSHAEVLPFAGRNGFVPDSWCPECAFYKVKRKAARPSDE